VSWLPDILLHGSRVLGQAVGPQNILGSRLMPTALFADANGRTQVLNALVNMLPHASPYIVVGTPYLWKGAVAGGATSVSPAWYDSLWHLSMHEGWGWNASLAEKVANYTDVSASVVASLRSIAPQSGAYFVRVRRAGARTCLLTAMRRTRATCTSRTTRRRSGARTTRAC
jgi:hypothetical protein